MKHLLWPSDRNVRAFLQAHPRLRLSSLGLNIEGQFYFLSAFAGLLMLAVLAFGWSVIA